MTTPDLRSRTLALAGLLQSLKLVRQIADTGHAEADGERTMLDSVFRIDADTVDAVYGSASALRSGLHLLHAQLTDRGRDEALSRLGMSVLRIERGFVADEAMIRRVGDGVRDLQATAERQGSLHPDVIGRLGRLYADTISGLQPKVIVHGNPHYLQQPEVVAEIRALLLAALRSAVLWRQVGGSYWDFVFKRRQMVAVIDARLM